MRGQKEEWGNGMEKWEGLEEDIERTPYKFGMGPRGLHPALLSARVCKMVPAISLFGI